MWLEVERCCSKSNVTAPDQLSGLSSSFIQNRPCSTARKDSLFHGERVNKPGVIPGSFPGPAAGVQQFQAERHGPADLRELLLPPQHGKEMLLAASLRACTNGFPAARCLHLGHVGNSSSDTCLLRVAESSTWVICQSAVSRSMEPVAYLEINGIIPALLPLLGLQLFLFPAQREGEALPIQMLASLSV